MFGSPKRVFSLAITLLLAVNVIALPLQSDHKSQSDSLKSAPLALSTRGSIVSSASYGAILNTATSTRSVELQEPSLTERGVVGAVVDVVKGIAHLITKIIEKVKAKRRLKKAQKDFVKSVVEQGRHDHPEFNWLAIVSSIKHEPKFSGEKGKDWDVKQETLDSEGKKISYDVYFAREGDFYNNGHKGQVDWAYDGTYDVDKKSKGKHIVFKRPPGH
ncbi:hypothetical protein H0H87_000585 [Tephrocybe sp. NHM501043]|nr:hypothetical protein H0H87_000585 [Tephrocybe sp. NHM501043]